MSDRLNEPLATAPRGESDDQRRRTGILDNRPYRRVGIGECIVSNDVDDVLSSIALGSCVAVCFWEPSARVAGILHFMLPESRLNAERAREQPAVFADTGIALLFHSAYDLGAQKKRCVVRLIGGAEVGGTRPEAVGGIFNVGRRNVLAARSVLWRNGIMISGEAIGGTAARTIAMAVADGRVVVKSEGQLVAEL